MCIFIYNMRMELQEIIRAYKVKSNKSDAEIAREIGVDRSTVTRWSRGTVKKVSKEVMDRLSTLLGYNIEPLLKGMDIAVHMPVLGYVKGGYNLFAEENYLGEEDATLLEKRNADYYLKVEGNSMNGIGIMDGSLVLVQQRDHVENGDIGVVLVGDEVTVKRVVFKKDMLILEAANPDVENRYFTSKEVKDLPVRIIGKVISVKTYF